MKIFRMVRIRMEDWEVLEEDSFDYQGPIAELKGKSSGGGSSGQVAYPAYIQTRHQTVLDDAINIELPLLYQNNPYEGVESYDPVVEISNIDGAIDTFTGYVAGFDPVGDWTTLYTSAKARADELLDPAILDSIVDAFAADQVDVVNRALSQSHASLADAGAVMASAFVLSDAMIQAQAVRDLDRFRAELELQRDNARVQFSLNAAGQMSQILGQQLEAQKQMAAITIDANRIRLVANKEKWDQDIEINQKEVTWNIEMLQEVSSMLGAPSGAISGSSPLSKGQSALGGALQGAAMGAMVGGPWGAAAGAGIGVASAYGIPTIGGYLSGAL